MEVLQVPKARKLSEAYHDGRITVRESMEELDWCWDKKLYKGAREPIVELTSGPMTAVLKQDR